VNRSGKAEHGAGIALRNGRVSKLERNAPWGPEVKLRGKNGNRRVSEGTSNGRVGRVTTNGGPRMDGSGKSISHSKS